MKSDFAVNTSGPASLCIELRQVRKGINGAGAVDINSCAVSDGCPKIRFTVTDHDAHIILCLHR